MATALPTLCPTCQWPMQPVVSGRYEACVQCPRLRGTFVYVAIGDDTPPHPLNGAHAGAMPVFTQPPPKPAKPKTTGRRPVRRRQPRRVPQGARTR